MKSALRRIRPSPTSPTAAPAAEIRQPQSAPQPEGSAAAHPARGSVRGRLGQLFDMKKVPFEPAVSVERWDETTTLGICERWAEGQRKQPSIVGLARLTALNFERARPDSIPAEMRDQRL